MEFLNQLSTFLEADQTKMTEKQLARDIKNRAHQARVGFEIELYSSMGTSEAKNHIERSTEKYPTISKNITVDPDGSLPPSDELLSSSSDNYEFYNDPLEYLIEYTSVDYDDIALNVLEGQDDEQYYLSKYNEFEEMRSDAISTFNSILEHLNEMEGSKELDRVIREIESSIGQIEMLTLLDVVSGSYSLNEAMEDGYNALNMAESDAISTYASLIRELDDDIDVDETQYYNGSYIDDGDYRSYVETHSSDFLRDRLIEYYSDTYGRYSNDYDLGDGEFNGSPGKYGIEVITVTPVHLNQAYTYIKELSSMCNDEEMDNESTFVSTESEVGNTGLHIHFGLTKGMRHTFADILRVYLNTQERIDEIIKLAGRPFTHYSKNIDILLNAIENSITNGGKHDVPNLIENITSSYGFRYYGVNLVNLDRNKPKNTIEFRWADSSICFDETNFKAYFDILSDIMTESFTGSPEVEFRGYTIKDVSTSPSRLSIVISKDGKAISKFKNISVGGLMSERTSSSVEKLKFLANEIEAASPDSIYRQGLIIEYKDLLAKLKSRK